MMHLIGSTKVEQDKAPGGVLLGILSWGFAARFFKQTRTCLTCLQTWPLKFAPFFRPRLETREVDLWQVC